MPDMNGRAVLIAAIATAEPDPIASHQPRANRGLQHIVDRCLAKDPFDRWQTAHDLLIQLRWIASGGIPATTGAAAVTASEPFTLTRRTRFLLGSAANLLVVSTMQTFASTWLAPRIGNFQMANPDIAVRLDVSNHLVDFARDRVVGFAPDTGNCQVLAAQRRTHAASDGHRTPGCRATRAASFGRARGSESR